ncbi:MAG: DNA-directed RNA polymerase subunit beta, partial [Parcubacteria group bacterium Gr01-1014_70]
FRWLVEKGLQELFDDFFPVEDYSGNLRLEFVDFTVESPKHDEYHAREHNLTYEAPLRLRLRLVNKKTGELKEQEVFLGDFPIMTKRGTFVINGVERVIVSQLARSFGVYFTEYYLRGKKFFGAKIVPSRGAWLEFETDNDGALYVKIDRKRRIPITSLLRILGLKTDDDIKNAFHEIDNQELPYITRTLEKDSARTEDEAYVELYKRIRPGDLATVDNARDLLQSMFSSDRYDLSMVGRYKFNQRLQIKNNKKENSRVLDAEDLVAVVTEIIRMNQNPHLMADDIDHLGNRRVRGGGEMLQARLRIGLARMERIIKDRMSTLEPETLAPVQLVNARPFMAAMKEFFTTNQLSQFMDQTNILAELEHKRRVSALGPGGLTRERAGFEVRDVHPSHYGRICPIQTPEGPNIGLVGHLASYARISGYGIIETPYRKIKDGRLTNEVEYFTAFEEARYNIAHAGVPYDASGLITEELVEARIKGQPGVIARSEIQYMDISPQQAISIATSLIPFLEHDDANRALMGSNMQRQAVPNILPQAPIVATGVEERVASDSGLVVLAEEAGVVSAVDATKITVKSSKGEREYPLINYLRSNNATALHQRPTVKKGDKISKGQPLADNLSTENGQLALGQNVLVAFLSWGGANYEDAIILSERLVQRNAFSTVHIEDFTMNVRDTKLGPEVTTHDIPNVGEEKLKDLDEEGIVRIGAEVRPGDILVGKISPKGESDLTPEERLLRAIFGEKARDVKDSSLRMPIGKQGRVVDVKVFSRDQGDRLESGVIKSIRVEVAQLRKVLVGDKLAGRHGNKGVISKILPVEDMPYLEDGTPVDIILNPLGVASRMNIGQILETHLGWAAHKLGYQAITPSLIGATDEEIQRELEKAGLPRDGKVMLYDGRTGQSFDQCITVGMIYMMKLVHMVEDKIHMRSIGPYSLITQQPLGGKAQGGGQRFGEMEVWALEGFGAAHTLQEMLTIKSDDITGRVSTYDAIVRGEQFKNPNIPASFHVLVNELKGLALDVDLVHYEKHNS